MKYLVLLTFCLWIAAVQSQEPEDEEVDQFIEALCRPKTAEGIARCGDLLPPRGKDIVYGCTRNLTWNFRDNMLYAAGTFCDREDLRDPLFRCWEGDLTQLYDNSKELAEKRDINRFQGCLQNVLDSVFVEQTTRQQETTIPKDTNRKRN